MIKLLKHLIQIILWAWLLVSTSVLAEVQISKAWVRATAPGQQVGAAYLTLTSNKNAHMVYAETKRANSVEMHHMTVKDGVMRMRSMDEIALPAGKAVTLAPNGLHLMLFDIAQPLKVGEQLEFRLCFKNAQGKIEEQFVTMPVKAAH